MQDITRGDLVRFHETWFRPNNTSLVVVGDVSMETLIPMLRHRFGAWERGSVPDKIIAEVPDKVGPELYLLDRPGSQQSLVLAADVAPPKAGADEIAIETMNRILGGSYSSRINMNLREEKGWSYFFGSILVGARGQRPFLIYGNVQKDKTKESVQEVMREVEGMVADRSVTAEEVAQAQLSQTLSLAGRWETSEAIRSSIEEIIRYDLPLDYWDIYASAVRALEVDDVAAVAQEVVRPDQLVWLIVGDRREIEPGLRELGFDAITLIDSDGNTYERIPY